MAVTTDLRIFMLMCNLSGVFGLCPWNEQNISTTDSFGTIITSPGYPSDYDSYEDECWTFIVDFGTVTIEITDMNMEANYDYLRIFDADIDGNVGGEIVSLTGEASSLTYTSTTPGMYIQFTSDESNQFKGFQACVCPTYAACSCWFVDNSTGPPDQCGPNTYVIDPEDTDGVLITSPGYPDEFYGRNEDLCWTLTVHTGSVSLEIPDLDTESIHDVLEIYEVDLFGNDDYLADTLSGQMSHYYYSSSGRLRLKFKSDGSIQEKGFQACACHTEAPSCSCNFYGDNWSNWSPWSSGGNGGLSVGAKIGLGVGIPLIVIIPIIIGVSVACCAKTTKSPNSYGAQRQAVAATGVPVTYRNTPASNRNQVTPSGPGAPASQPVGPTPYNAPPPTYNSLQQQQGGVLMVPGNVPVAPQGPVVRYGGPQTMMYTNGAMGLTTPGLVRPYRLTPVGGPMVTPGMTVTTMSTSMMTPGVTPMTGPMVTPGRTPLSTSMITPGMAPVPSAMATQGMTPMAGPVPPSGMTGNPATTTSDPGASAPPPSYESVQPPVGDPAYPPAADPAYPPAANPAYPPPTAETQNTDTGPPLPAVYHV